MNNFEDMISVHRSLIAEDIDLICDYLRLKSKMHDMDKVEPGVVNDTYVTHFPTLKKIPYGTAEYKQYEKDYFSEAHYLHAQNRHHFYNPINEADDIDLFDLLEAIVDIKQSQKQYSTNNKDVLFEVLKSKGIYELELEDLIKNTVIRMEKLNEAKD